ncbi:Nicotinamide N-methyltransferase [Apiospora kogelbergensis]|uniref:Nicotinamide N-methyltransferase n=1 Tax=Apiospora kogelbergensis TaxID=1337665 RepID=A0AAW0QJ17_9PEZI
MILTARISIVGPADEPEDYLSDSLGAIFPDDVTNSHGSPDQSLLYTSPYLPKPLEVQVADPIETRDRLLFSHYLWNASLLLAELVEAGSLEGVVLEPELGVFQDMVATAKDGTPGNDAVVSKRTSRVSANDFDIRGKSTLEVGAGTGLPSMMAALLGATEVTAVDYPTPLVVDTLRRNIKFNTQPQFSPSGDVAPRIAVDGHAWGELDTSFALENRQKFDRLFVCDCLWMPDQHANLQRSVAWFLKDGAESRAWVIAGFHSGRDKMASFFDGEALKAVGLAVEHIWERDCEGIERPWSPNRGPEDPGVRKRWLTIAILRRTT